MFLPYDSVWMLSLGVKQAGMIHLLFHRRRLGSARRDGEWDDISMGRVRLGWPGRWIWVIGCAVAGREPLPSLRHDLERIL